MGRKRTPPAAPPPAPELELEEHGDAPAYAGVDDFDDKVDDDEEESELELEPTDDDEEDDVPRIRKPAPDSSPPKARTYRWIVPHVDGPAFAHVHVVGSAYVLCKSAHAEGGIYPPAADVPRCEACKLAIAREHVG